MAHVDPSPEVQLRMYREMLRLRILDERMMRLQRQGRVGFYGAATGQEATPIACAAALRDTDWVFPALREGAVMLWRGYDLTTYVSQVFGNGRDALKGRQMPSHYADAAVRQVSWSSCIGNQLPQAVGAAHAARRRGDDGVVMAFVGDGGVSTGDFHHALNFAGVWQVPLVVVCQNNQWAISLPAARQTASENVAIKATAYGVRGVRTDGNDAVAVWRAAKEAVDRARSGFGPSLLECLTYRIGAHSSSDDPTRYRDEAEVQVWRRRDPIDRMRARLGDAGLWDEAREAALRAELDDSVRTAVEAAEAAPPPPLDSLFDDVYADRPWHLAEQRAACLTGPRAPERGQE